MNGSTDLRGIEQCSWRLRARQPREVLEGVGELWVALGVVNAANWLTGQFLRPVGEGVPRGSLTDGDSDPLNDDQEKACPDGGAVDFAGGPPIVSP